MDSETGTPDLSSFIENLVNSRNREISRFFLPFIIGVNPTNPVQDSTSPSQETQDQENPSRNSRERIILINSITQSMFVIESRRSSNSLSSGFDSLIDEFFSNKNGHPPASKASIDALPSVEVVVNGEKDEQCVVCLEEWVAGEKAKEMPCKHMFHGECIEKWLKIHGSCPVCRYEMPVDEADDGRKRGDGERRGGIWVEFTFGSDRGSGENNQNTVVSGNNESSDR